MKRYRANLASLLAAARVLAASFAAAAAAALSVVLAACTQTNNVASTKTHLSESSHKSMRDLGWLVACCFNKSEPRRELRAQIKAAQCRHSQLQILLIGSKRLRHNNIHSIRDSTASRKPKIRSNWCGRQCYNVIETLMEVEAS